MRINYTNSPIDRTFQEAVEHSNLKDITYFVERGADVNAKDREGKIPLYHAFESYEIFGQKVNPIIQYLVANGADVNAKDNWGNTLLHRFSSYKSATYLVRLGADVNAKDNDGNTVLHRSYIGEYTLLKYFIEHGADINVKNNNKETPLMYHIKAYHLYNSTEYFDIIKYLVEQGADVNAKDNKGIVPLLYVRSNYEIVKYLIENGANINVKDTNGHTLLATYIYDEINRTCTGGYHCDMIEYLVKHGANINAKDNDGFTLLDIAQPVYKKQNYVSSKLTNCLVRLGAKHGSTHELYCEIFLGNLKRVKHLINKKKANVNAGFNSKGVKTPLQVAVENGHLKIAKYLMDKGAKIKEDVLYTAINNGHLTIIKHVFENHKNKIISNKNSDFYTTLLCNAIQSGQLEIVKYLIEKQKVPINKTNSQNQTPLQVAIENKRLTVAKYLRQRGGRA